VTGSVGDRNLQRITVEAVVEGVSADGAGWFEPAGDRELPRLTGVGARQQPPLDLRGQCEVRRALTPFEQIGVPAVRDDDVGEGVRGRRDIGHDLLVRDLRQGQLEQPDGLATIGHRHGQQRTVDGRAHVDPLGA
jgi:hypothetical protein